MPVPGAGQGEIDLPRPSAEVKPMLAIREDESHTTNCKPSTERFYQYSVRTLALFKVRDVFVNVAEARSCRL